MTETKHTPGPWAVCRSADNDIMAVKARDPTDERLFEVCEVWGENNDKSVTPMSKGNARLIAAAPDLLEAIREFLPIAQVAFLWQNNGARPGEVERYRDGYQKLQSAIAKATKS